MQNYPHSRDFVNQQTGMATGKSESGVGRVCRDFCKISMPLKIREIDFIANSALFIHKLIFPLKNKSDFLLLRL